MVEFMKHYRGQQEVAVNDNIDSGYAELMFHHVTAQPG
jgi:hypothetical protein